MARGNAELIGTLRTHNIFPISTYASEIADNIRELYSLSEDSTRELFFDDRELLTFEQDLD
jgi:hypothetical protein